MTRPKHLAWHETLELHELTAFQANILIKCKKSIRKIPCPVLQGLYGAAITSLEQNLREILQFFPYAPDVREEEEEERADERVFYASDLLIALKTAVRNYSIAITETATPALRVVLVKQLNAAIKLHEQVYEYLYDRGYYPSYDFERLLQNDLRIAQSALRMPF